MDTMSAFMAPIMERHGDQYPTLPTYSHSPVAKLHLRSTCAPGRKLPTLHRSQINARNVERFCARCVKPGVVDATIDATIADAFLITASQRARYLLQTATQRYGSDSLKRTEIVGLLKLADLFAGGTHPATAKLKSLVPGLADPTDVPPAASAAVLGACWVPGPQEYEWARILSGDETKADVMWDVFRSNVRFGLGVTDAATSTVMSLESSDVTNAKLPDVLTSTRDQHASTRAWMEWEWEHSCELARTGLTAVLCDVVAAAMANPERFGWMVAPTTQSTAQSLARLAANYGWEFVTGHDAVRNGACLVACPTVIFESLKVLDPDARLTPIPDLDAELGLSIHRDPGIIRIAETLRDDDFTLSWTDALDRALLVARITN